MKLKAILTFFSIVGSLSACSQFNETIRTGRPGQAIGSYTVGMGIFQVQSGFDFFQSDNKNTGLKVHGILNNTVLRFGLTESFELSASVEVKAERFSLLNADTDQHGLSALDVGMRYHIIDAKGLRPNVGFQIRARLPFSSPDYKTKDIAPRMILVVSQRLSKTFFLITNWGANWSGNDSAPTGTYVLNLSFPFNSKLGAFVENYGSFQQGTATTNFDTGLAWLLTNDFQLDLYGGIGSNRGVNEYFLSTGVSWRSYNRTRPQ